MFKRTNRSVQTPSANFWLLALSITLFATTTQSASADILFTATADGDAQTFGGDDIDTSDDRLTTAQSGGLVRNIILEFDLGSLGIDDTINSATLNLVKFGNLSNVGSAVVPLELYAYSGDGIVNLADFDAVGAAVGTGGVPLGTANGTAINLAFSDIGLLQSIADSGGGLLTVRIETNSFGTLDIASLENTSGFDVPTLSLNVTSSVPEPSSALVVTALLCGLTIVRRRQ